MPSTMHSTFCEHLLLLAFTLGSDLLIPTCQLLFRCHLDVTLVD